MADPLKQYLSRYAEPEAAAADALPGDFGHALIVPAYGERESLFATLGSVREGSRGETLIVVVLNAREDSPADVHEANTAARDRLRAGASEAALVSAELGVESLRYPHGRVILVDRASPGRYLPEGQGVGLARKIGNDLALRLSASNRLAAGWLHNTDADTVLPDDYFDQTDAREDEDCAAAIYFFEHRFDPDERLALAARLYEISLRYYVLGLAWAGSPYAYEAMGSCIAVRPVAYARVRGFPKKNAAEDFYVLDKLAKVGSILRLGGAPLLLEGRISERVPFGTGKALSRLLSSRRGLEGFTLYHPAVFAHLAAWLRVLDQTASSGGRAEAALAELPQGNPFFRADVLLAALERMKALPAIRKAIEESTTPDAMRRRFHTWFDAFRTLKLVHALRDEGLPSLAWRDALGEAPFTGLSSSTVEEPEPLRKRLAAEERKLSEEPAGVA
jgi:hypothetical protein